MEFGELLSLRSGAAPDPGFLRAFSASLPIRLPFWIEGTRQTDDIGSLRTFELTALPGAVGP